MAQVPTPEQTAARHRAKLAGHPFVPARTGRLCAHRVHRLDPMTMSLESRACGLPRRMHRED